MHHRAEIALGWVFSLLIVLVGSSIAQTNEPDPFTADQRNHWAFRPVIRATIPNVDSTQAADLQNSIDSFIAAKLNSTGNHLASPADRRTLLRRVTFDLIGLPPTPEELDEFLSDESPDAYERVVDRLLSNPHHGEAWGRNWLDVVRFAETAGFNADPIRPNAYTYRDYVIRAFNRDLTFDRFILDQLAGDELFPDDAESQTGTAYCRMWADESNASNVHLARQLSLDDLTGNVGAAFLGLSIGCAECHDHKFDPILQTDFYQLQAFFPGIVLEDKVPVGTHEQLTRYRQSERAWLDETASLRKELNQLERDARIKLQGDRRMKFPAEILEAIDLPVEDRSTLQRQWAFWTARQMTIVDANIPKHLDELAKPRREELLLLMTDAKLRRPLPPNQEVTVMAVAELTTQSPPTHRLENGSYDKPQELVEPNFPSILRGNLSLPLPTIVPPNERSSGRRSVLAKWLAAADNPLTHRVWMNRLWQGHFGQGLVSNANDFGTQTPAPSDPELFDWLTSDFIDHGFQTKRMQRLIVQSASYRQSSEIRPTDESGTNPAITAAPAYSSFPRQRLSSERIRDGWLMASGQLNDSMYGPGVRPELPANFASAEWIVSEPSQRVRRSVYIFAKRNLPYPMMAAFDFPDMHETCGCRTKTIIAPQALMLLNNGIVVEAGRQLASRSRSEATSADPAEQIRRAWQITFGRPASDKEVNAALKFVANQHRLIDQAPASDAAAPKNPDDEAFADLCHAFLNANEFLFLD